MKQHARYLVPLALLTACSGGSDDSENVSFLVRSTNVAVAPTLATPIRVSGAYIGFLASEAATSTGGAGTDLNGDGAANDAVAHVVNTATTAQFRLGVAARDLAWAGSELYVVVREADDGRDWSGDTTADDDVLLHWSEAAGTLTFVDDLVLDPGNPGEGHVAVLGLGSRVVYAAATATPGTGNSNLRFVEASAPLVPVPIATTDAGVNEISARLLGEDEGLVFVAFDEILTMRPLNGDGDHDEDTVLALLDGTDAAAVARCTELAVDAASPRRAKSIAANDWRVGFLVDEDAQDEGSLNSVAAGVGRPAYCAMNDTDVLDHVLHVLRFSTWDADPSANPPINHGLAARDRIAFAGTSAAYVAAVVAESDENCNLNNGVVPDGDTTDRVVRWMPVADSVLDPIEPVNDPDETRALFDTPGGGHGLYELQNRFVIVSSEADGGDIDVNPLDANLVGWLAPATLPNQWDFFHGMTGTQVVEASWVNGRETESRLGVAFTERIGGTSLNQGTASLPGDNDTLDSVATFAFFSSGSLVFPGFPIAVDRDGAGILTARGHGFYRVSENEDSRDTNGDSDENDYILERTNLVTGQTLGMSVVSEVQRDVIEVARFGSKDCGALLAREASQGAGGGTDFNGDGDRTDFVLRWFRF